MIQQCDHQAVGVCSGCCASRQLLKSINSGAKQPQRWLQKPAWQTYISCCMCINQLTAELSDRRLHSDLLYYPACPITQRLQSFLLTISNLSQLKVDALQRSLPAGWHGSHLSVQRPALQAVHSPPPMLLQHLHEHNPRTIYCLQTPSMTPHRISTLRSHSV